VSQAENGCEEARQKGNQGRGLGSPKELRGTRNEPAVTGLKAQSLGLWGHESGIPKLCDVGQIVILCLSFPLRKQDARGGEKGDVILWDCVLSSHHGY
jgi:hypothetical protein